MDNFRDPSFTRTGSSVLVIALVAAVMSVYCGQWADAQSTSASARQTTVSSGRPNAIEIRRNNLTIQQKELQRELVEVRRCIQTARLPQVLRDSEGNLNIVPEIDIINCGRRLSAISRQLQVVTRQATRLGADAQATSLYVQRKAREASAALRISGGQ
jgi:hypothetical protein